METDICHESRSMQAIGAIILESGGQIEHVRFDGLGGLGSIAGGLGGGPSSGREILLDVFERIILSERGALFMACGSGIPRA